MLPVKVCDIPLVPLGVILTLELQDLRRSSMKDPGPITGFIDSLDLNITP